MVKQPLTWPSLDNEWEKRVSFVGIDYKYFLENKYFNKRYEFSLKDPVSHSLKETLCTFTLWPGRVTSLYRSWNVSCRSWNGTTSMHPIKLISNGPSAALTLMTRARNPTSTETPAPSHANPNTAVGHFFPLPIPLHIRTLDPPPTCHSEGQPQVGSSVSGFVRQNSQDVVLRKVRIWEEHLGSLCLTPVEQG